MNFDLFGFQFSAFAIRTGAVTVHDLARPVARRALTVIRGLQHQEGRPVRWGFDSGHLFHVKLNELGWLYSHLVSSLVQRDAKRSA